MGAEGHAIKVVPVRDGDDLESFLHFPWEIYRGDPLWVPPLLSLQRQFLDPEQGPFFEIGEAQYFLAFQNNRPVGRISAHINHLYEQQYDSETGFFGFFECIQNQEVASRLFAAAAAWLQNHGKKRLLGPLSFSIYDEVGLLVDGFDSLPAILHAHNPAYYTELLSEWGFKKVMDWYAYRVTREDIDGPAMQKQLQRLEDIIKAQNLVVAPLDYKDMARRAQEVHDLFNKAWSSNWGHLPLTRRQFDDLLENLKPLLRPDLVLFLLDNDRLVGFSIFIPDINPFIQTLNGRLNLWDKLKFFYEVKFKHIRKARVLIFGIDPAYQGRLMHFAMIFRTTLYLVQKTSCEVCDCSLIADTNRPIIKVLKAMGAQPYKTFRLFDRAI
jgi:hypothetical protein